MSDPDTPTADLSDATDGGVASPLYFGLHWALFGLSYILGLVCLLAFLRFWNNRDKRYVEARRPMLVAGYAVTTSVLLFTVYPALIFTDIGHEWWSERIFYPINFTIEVAHECLLLCLIFFILVRCWVLLYDHQYTQATIDRQWRSTINPNEENFWLDHRHTFGNIYRLMTSVISLCFAIFVVYLFYEFLWSDHNEHEKSIIVIASRFCLGLPAALLILVFMKYITKLHDEFFIRKEMIYLTAIICLDFARDVIMESLESVVAHDNADLYMYVIDVVVSFSMSFVQTYWVVKTGEERQRELKILLAMRTAQPNTDMVDVLRSRSGFEMFMRHCQRELSIENVLFIVEIAQYRSMVIATADLDKDTKYQRLDPTVDLCMEEHTIAAVRLENTPGVTPGLTPGLTPGVSDNDPRLENADTNPSDDRLRADTNESGIEIVLDLPEKKSEDRSGSNAGAVTQTERQSNLVLDRLAQESSSVNHTKSDLVDRASKSPLNGPRLVQSNSISHSDASTDINKKASFKTSNAAHVLQLLSGNSSSISDSDHTAGGSGSPGGRRKLGPRRERSVSTARAFLYREFQSSILVRDWLPIAEQFIPSQDSRSKPERTSIPALNCQKSTDIATATSLPISASIDKTAGMTVELSKDSRGLTKTKTQTKTKASKSSKTRSSTGTDDESTTLTDSQTGSGTHSDHSGTTKSASITGWTSSKSYQQTKKLKRHLRKLRECKADRISMTNREVYEYAEFLYTKYMDDLAPLLVNVKSHTMHNLQRIFNNSLTTDEGLDAITADILAQSVEMNTTMPELQTMIGTYLYHVFDMAFDEIWTLLRTDVFSRFRLTEKFMFWAQSRDVDDDALELSRIKRKRKKRKRKRKHEKRSSQIHRKKEKKKTEPKANTDVQIEMQPERVP